MHKDPKLLSHARKETLVQLWPRSGLGRGNGILPT
jgi:hypothetical protein